MSVAWPKLTRKWIGKTANDRAVGELAKELGINPLVARVLATRNCSRVESAEAFLSPKRSQLLNPFLMHDIERAVRRIRQAIEMKERVLVVGDYDVDGVCSVAIVSRAFRALGVEPDWFVPSRFRDGYGLNPSIVDRAAEAGASLIVTVDNGISAFPAAARAKEHGIDVIVTDHHAIGDIPDVYAIVHPAFPKSMYSFHELCGAGVAFKLSEALLGRFPEEYLDLVAVATVADQMPLIGENRVVVTEGLERINRELACVGLTALVEAAGLSGKRVSADHLAFQVGPRLNAVGRLADASEAVELLLTDDVDFARKTAQALNHYNERRKVLQEDVEAQALRQIEDHPEWLDARGLVVTGENWNEGVIGIVAGRLTQRLHKSTLCISVNGDEAKGSGRAIPNFDLYRTLADVQRLSGLFTKWGGHEAAAGFSLKSADVDALRTGFTKAVEGNWFEDVPLEPFIDCDAPLELGELSYPLVDDLRRLEPLGRGNPEPVFFVRDARIASVQTIGREAKHLKIWVRDAIGRTYPVLAFGHGDELDAWQGRTTAHLLVTVRDNHFNGNRTLQMQLVDSK